MRYPSLSAILLGTTAALVVYQPIAIATQTPQEIARLAETLTVQVNPDPNDPSMRSGSGFMISKEGNRYTILTCDHVLSGQPASIRTYDGRSYPILDRQSLAAGGIDLALLTFESSADYPVATLGDSEQAAVGSQIFVFGYPVNSLARRAGEERNFEFSPGFVTSRLRTQSSGYTLRYNAITQGGMSGGPVFDVDGRIVGIHGMGENDAATVRNLQGGSASSEFTVQTKTGFNSAIPINTYIELQKQSAAAPAVEVDASPSSDQPEQHLQNPDSALAFDARAQVRSAQGDREGALSDSNEAIRLDPNNAVTYFRRASLRNSQGDKQGAIDDYTQAIALNPTYTSAYFNRAMVRHSLGDTPGAIEDFSSVIDLNPNDITAYQNRGVLRRSLNDGRGTLEDFDRVVQLSPDQFASYYNRALAWSMVGERQNVVADFTQALTLRPNYTPAYINRALAKRWLGDRAGAIEDLSYVLSYEPDNAVAQYNRGILRRDLGDREGALADLQQAAVLFQQAGDTANYEKATYAIQRLSAQPVPNPSAPTSDDAVAPL